MTKFLVSDSENEEDDRTGKINKQTEREAESARESGSKSRRKLLLDSSDSEVDSETSESNTSSDSVTSVVNTE